MKKTLSLARDGDDLPRRRDHCGSGGEGKRPELRELPEPVLEGETRGRLGGPSLSAT
jgi:hypothetical protein